MKGEVKNPKKVETTTAVFYIATYVVAYSPDRLCAIVEKTDNEPFAVQKTQESRDEFVHRAEGRLLRM